MDDESTESAQPAERVDRVERDLAEALESLHSIFTYHPDGVFRLDLEGRFVAVNPAAERLSGYSEAELLGMSFVELLPDDEAVAATMPVFHAILASRPQEFSARFVEKGGAVAELEIVGLPVLVADQVVGIYGIAKDVTERCTLERAIVQAQRSAESANEAKSVFLANVSHEIRTPLSSVIGAAEILGDSDLDPDQRRLVTLMDRAGVRLLRLIDQLLDFSRIEAGGVDVVSIPLSVRALVDEITESAGKAASVRGLQWTATVDDEVPDVLRGDPMLVSQVLENLVGNATKFTEAGTVTLTVACATTVRSEDDAPVSLAFSVADTGIGLEPAHRRSMFEPFSQADPSITRLYGGTGLGLAIVRGLVARLGGTVTVDSTPGEGSTFRVVLPFDLP